MLKYSKKGYKDGQLSKWWESAEWLIKNMTNVEIGRTATETAQVEINCFELCQILKILVAEI